MMYGSFSVGSPERRRLVKKVDELLPDPATIKEPKARHDMEKRRKKVLSRVEGRPEAGVDIVVGNAKIGTMSQFSLPAGQHFRKAACPGATELCERLCYAKKIFFRMHEWRYFLNWAYVLLFPERFLEIWRMAALTGVVRVHVGGDYFSADYVKMWLEICRSRSSNRFYSYTRSWQDGHGNVRKDFLAPLRKLATLDNSRLVLSCDRVTGVPPADLIPGSIRAWLARDDQDLPGMPVELIFRDKRGMTATASQMGGAPVCPVERSPKYKKISGKISCTNCTFCYSTGHLMFGQRDDDPSKLDMFAGLDVEERASSLFREFWDRPSGPAMRGSSAATEDCVCGAAAICVHCRTCALCLCGC